MQFASLKTVLCLALILYENVGNMLIAPYVCLPKNMCAQLEYEYTFPYPRKYFYVCIICERRECECEFIV